MGDVIKAEMYIIEAVNYNLLISLTGQTVYFMCVECQSGCTSSEHKMGKKIEFGQN